MIRFRPSSLNCLFCFFGAVIANGSASPRSFAHRAFWAIAILLRVATENFRLPATGVEAGRARADLDPESIVRSSLICSSIRRFCPSNPSIAALMISGENFRVAMLLILAHHSNLSLCRQFAPQHLLLEDFHLEGQNAIGVHRLLLSLRDQRDPKALRFSSLNGELAV